MVTQFQQIPIVEAARRRRLAIDNRTTRRTEVEASCPFCGDRRPGKHHLSMNTDKNVFRCNLCAVCGNSITLYARLKGVSNKEAYRDLTGTGGIYPPVSRLAPQYAPQYTERQPAALPLRHAVYSDMLNCLTLFDAHRRNLRKRGLSDERIAQNGYKSMPEAKTARRIQKIINIFPQALETVSQTCYNENSSADRKRIAELLEANRAIRQDAKCPTTPRPYAGDHSSRTAEYCAIPYYNRYRPVIQREIQENGFP